tara:strand:+ start:197 stop:328 length:132 start_codon:yes stop_codon:yes gene_type:complete
MKDNVIKGIALNPCVKPETTKEAKAECKKRGINLSPKKPKVPA